MEPIRITHFSDTLCVWAYVSQIRIDEQDACLRLARQHARQVDRGERLAVPCARARHGDHPPAMLLAQLIELDAQALVALGRERFRRGERDEA